MYCGRRRDRTGTRSSKVAIARIVDGSTDGNTLIGKDLRGIALPAFREFHSSVRRWPALYKLYKL